VVNWSHVLIHHSATPDTPMVETHGYRKYHTEARGWRDLGYAYVVELAGHDYAMLAGRPLSWPGAHCRGMNTQAIGICLAGDFSVVPPPIAQQRCAARHVAALCDLFNIPTENIQGHRDYRATECPGRMFNLEPFRQMVEGYRRAAT